MTVLFTKQGCAKCDWVKEKVDIEKVDELVIMQLDDDNSDALAMLAFHECVTLAEKKLPILVSDTNEVITGALKIKNRLEKLGGVISNVKN
jgi:hypothetical protein